LGGLTLLKENQTTSWKRIIGPKAEPGVYMVFFTVKPHPSEDMHDPTRPNEGEYLQAAVLDNVTRILCPCNGYGTGLLLGKDVEYLCKNGAGNPITQWLNETQTWKGVKGIYPLQIGGQFEPSREIRLAGVYEVGELKRYEEYNPSVHKAQEDLITKGKLVKKDTHPI
jgi:hypothetical protein